MNNMFGTKQNNETADNKSINTRIYQFKNKDGFEPSTLQITGWNEMCAFRINPTLPPEKQSKEQIFDYDKFVSTSLNLEKIILLIYKINNDIIPAIENGKEKNVGISVGGDSLITVGTGKAITGEIRPYLAIHKALNQETKKPEQSIYYEFRKSMTIDDYDANSGSYTVTEGYHSEFKLFVELLKSFVKNSNAVHHVNRYGNRFITDKMMNTINSIASKVGADTGSKYNGLYRKNVFGNTSNSEYTSDYNESTNNLEELGDLNDLMNE